jgi:flavin-dependent dehydrogenase
MYDAIVVGARCAGASTAMLLARKGLDVLLVDRATFPSEIPHGHFIHRHGPRRLAEWGLLERVLESNCPPVTTFTADLGDFPLTGEDLVVDGVPFAVGPRRSRIDGILVEAASEAGAEVRDGFAVQEYLGDGDRVTGIRGRHAASGRTATERASIVIGADGRNSALAKHVRAPTYESAATAACYYFSYWSGVTLTGLEMYLGDRRVIFAHPTNDDLVTMFVGFPIAELPRVRADIEREVMAAVDRVPQLSARIRAGRREERFYGAGHLPNFLRKPYGPGWALVGDAGCHKDPFLALGVCDALRDAELLSDAIEDGLSGRRPQQAALAKYERRRNEATLPDYRENLALAQFRPLPTEHYALRAALRGNQDDTNRFYLAREGLVEPHTFFDEDNLRRIVSGSPSA